MTWWHRLLRRRQMEKQLEKELRFHLDQGTADLIARGYLLEEARRQVALAGWKTYYKTSAMRFAPCGRGRRYRSDAGR